MPAEAGGIRGGIAAGKLADQLRKRQTGYITAQPRAVSRDIPYQRVKLAVRRPNPQIPFSVISSFTS